MGKKKCQECLSCFNIFWIDGIRYYHCWLCQTTYKGRDDELELCEDPRKSTNTPVKNEEQVDGTKENQ